MVVGNRQAELGVRGEAAVWREEADGGGFKRVLRRKHNFPVVHPALVLAPLRALQDEVPLQQVGRGRMGRDMGDRFLS